MDNYCHIPDLVEAFSHVENGGLKIKILSHMSCQIKQC